MRMVAVNEVYPSWQPDEFGMGRATAVSLLLVGMMIGGMVLLASNHEVTPLPPPMQVQMLQLPPEQLAQAPAPPTPPPPQPDVDTPPPPPLALAPPNTLPPSRIEIPKPPPPKPVAKPRPPRPVPPQVARTSPTSDAPPSAVTSNAPPVANAPPPAAATADTSSGIGPYRAGLHNLIESHVEIGPQIQALGISGTAVIEAVIAPDGHLISAHVARSSGNGLIDKAALAAVQRGGFRPFGNHMPTAPITISVPIEILPGAGD